MGLKISQLPDKAAEDGMMIPASVGGMTYRLLVGMAGGLAKFLHKHDVADVNGLAASLADKVTTNISPLTIEVSKSGSDTTGDGSAAKPYLTIQKAINSLPKCLMFKVTIRVHAGVYDEDLVLWQFNGAGELELLGADGESVSFKSMYALEVYNRFTLFNFNVTGYNDGGHSSIGMSSCIEVYLFGITCVQSSHPDAYRGAVTAEYCGRIYIGQNTVISNKNVAVEAVGSTVYLNNFVTGTGNTIAIRCGSGWGSYGGYVQKGGATIAGAEEKEYGGQIW